MSDPTKPLPSTVEEITPPVQEQRTIWATAAGVVSALAGGISGVVALFEGDPVLKSRLILAGGILMALSAVLANIGSVLARSGGVAAAATVLEKVRGQDVLR